MEIWFQLDILIKFFNSQFVNSFYQFRTLGDNCDQQSSSTLENMKQTIAFEPLRYFFH